VLKKRLSHLILLSVSLSTGFLAGFGVLILASQSRASMELGAIQHASVVMPEGTPEPGQEAVDMAMAIFKIVRPEGAEMPVYDPDLKDRGLTVKSTWMSKTKVFVGPSAFSSWGMLGSTLAHEIEVHCRQNFPLIVLKDQLGLGGTAEAEREAYQYEIRNAARFGLNNRDQNLIAATVEYYYPREK
jgi:hypothetical protein